MRLKGAINKLFALHTDQDKKKIEDDTERDFFMSGQEALEYGIVDKVITKREMINMGNNKGSDVK
jgi:ATP-dependent Clp protease protease subunit